MVSSSTSKVAEGPFDGDWDAEGPPSDWPAPGPIDLTVHDLPHASSSLEWWYVNCHLELGRGQEVSIFAAFFRERVGTAPDGSARYAHSISWGVSDPGRARYRSFVAVDRSAPELGLAKLRAGAGARDVRLTAALGEVLEKGTVPLPTRMLRGDARVSQSELILDLDGNRFRRLSCGDYLLTLAEPERGLVCSLRFHPLKAPMRFGRDGVVTGVADETMFYYYLPRCDVSGDVFLDGAQRSIVSGSGWYDHEFGVRPATQTALRVVGEAQRQTSWRWVSLQLEDQVEVSVYIISRGDSVLDNWTVITDASGQREVHHDAVLTPTNTWRSTRSFVEYPVAWRLEVVSARLSLDIGAPFPDQEVLTIISDPGFWEGRVDAQGSLRGAPVAGRGWVECKGFRFENVEAFFAAVGREVRTRLDGILPLEPGPSDVAAWVGRRGEPRSFDAARGVDSASLAEWLARPIREMTDRGGKAWRSYAALACIDVVGGDSRKFLHWLTLPELLHVGSLIVDDVEDESVMRGGGVACHVKYGTACAINAGTAAYFLAEPPLEKDRIPDADKLLVYRYYFEAMRAGHAGQALDLAGCAELAQAAAESGRIDRLEGYVLSVHRLKTAVPAAMLARIGAVLGGGNAAQIAALGEFFESLGLAFQIVDEVLNLRGFENDLKQRGEDISQGKVTLPVVKGLSLLAPGARAWLWQTLQSRPKDAKIVSRASSELEACGAIDECTSAAKALVESSWSKLDPLLPDSQFKVMFRAFAAFVLERHY